jgi:3-oxoacyl-[acyl-carrier-protein] synthase II
MKRVAITGVGIVDALGNNYKTCFENLLNDTDPIGPITKIDFEKYKNIKVRIAAELHLPSEDRTPLYVRAAMSSVEQAINSSGVIPNENVAIVYSTLGAGSVRNIDYMAALESGKNKFSPKAMLEIQLDYLAGKIAQQYKISGPSVSMNTSCSTFLNSLDYACRLVDEYDYVIAGGSDTVVDPAHVWWFQQFHALTQEHSRPFDQSRNGFVLGEGAGCLILESEDRARSRGAKIYGFVNGIGLATELEGLTGLNETAAKQAVSRALKKAGVNTVDFINAHATSTVLGDELEYRVMKEYLPNVPMYSVKAKIGHTMAACGVIELIYGLASLENNIVPRTFGLTNPLADDSVLLTENLEKQCNTFIKNSYAFGGRCASVVVSKDHG